MTLFLFSIGSLIKCCFVRSEGEMLSVTDVLILMTYFFFIWQGQTIANHHLPGRIRYKRLGQGRNSTQRDTWCHREKNSSTIQIYADSARPVHFLGGF